MHMTAAQWDAIKKTYGAWWRGELKRPILPLILEGEDPGRPEPNIPLLSQATCHDLSIPAEKIIDRIDYELSKNIYCDDAFPYFNMDCFGPGVLAAMLGARLDNQTGYVWFFPEKEVPIGDLNFEYDPENIWLLRIKDIYKAAYRRWGDSVIMGMPDLGGILDVLAVFVGADALLFALYDYPEDVKRLTWQLFDLWHKIYKEIDSIRGPIGYSDWMGAYSDSPCYILQSDFSYMIGPDMFGEFVFPEIKASCEALSNPFYHLDGPGEIPHLPQLLSIKALKGVQWVSGTGNPDQAHWPEIYQAICAAGKLTHVYAGFDALKAIYHQTNTLKGVFHSPIRVDVKDDAVIKRQIDEIYGLCD